MGFNQFLQKPEIPYSFQDSYLVKLFESKELKNI